MKKVQEFLDAVCASLNRKPGSITMDDTPDSLAEWDSVGHLSIIATVDQELGVPVDTEEMQSFTSIRQLVDLLKAKGALEE